MFPVDPFRYGLRFPLGTLQFSTRALEAINGEMEEFVGLLFAYQRGRWSERFQESNDHALIKGTMIVSIHELSRGVNLVIATKADRSATGILLLDECDFPEL